MDISFENFLKCLTCGNGLSENTHSYSCKACHTSYKKQGGAIFFLREAPQKIDATQQSDGLIYQIKSRVKKNPRLFHILNRVLGVYVGTSAKESISHLPEGSVIVNIGSGSEIIREDVINLDSLYHPGVRMVADAQNIPFRDQSVDAVISESLLEHVMDPARVVKEMHRILKPGGMVYIVTPFVIGFHSSPHDYYRWTTAGVRELLKDFREQELGIAVGPTNALTYILREWLALTLSFNSRTLHQIWILFFMALFAPLNLLDFILSRHTQATNIAHLFYFIGVKKVNPVTR